MKKIINTSKAPAPIGPYNQGVMTGNTLYISGQIAMDASTGTLVSDNIRAETQKVLDNLKAILCEAGMDQTNVVKCSIFITNMDDFGAINEVYAEFFTDTHPARETVEVSRLPKNVNVEISAIAVGE